MNKYKITIYDDREDAILPMTVLHDVKAVDKNDARIFGETVAKTLNLFKSSVEVEFVHERKGKK